MQPYFEACEAALADGIVEDADVLDAFELLTKCEGILPALESSHALAYLMSLKGKLDKDTTVVLNLSGRGDKDVGIVEKHRPVK